MWPYMVQYVYFRVLKFRLNLDETEVLEGREGRVVRHQVPEQTEMTGGGGPPSISRDVEICNPCELQLSRKARHLDIQFELWGPGVNCTWRLHTISKSITACCQLDVLEHALMVALQAKTLTSTSRMMAALRWENESQGRDILWTTTFMWRFPT